MVDGGDLFVRFLRKVVPLRLVPRSADQSVTVGTRTSRPSHRKNNKAPPTGNIESPLHRMRAPCSRRTAFRPRWDRDRDAAGLAKVIPLSACLQHAPHRYVVFVGIFSQSGKGVEQFIEHGVRRILLLKVIPRCGQKLQSHMTVFSFCFKVLNILTNALRISLSDNSGAWHTSDVSPFFPHFQYHSLSF